MKYPELAKILQFLLDVPDLEEGQASNAFGYGTLKCCTQKNLRQNRKLQRGSHSDPFLEGFEAPMCVEV